MMFTDKFCEELELVKCIFDIVLLDAAEDHSVEGG
jgi:hypothetical protein